MTFSNKILKSRFQAEDISIQGLTWYMKHHSWKYLWSASVSNIHSVYLNAVTASLYSSFCCYWRFPPLPGKVQSASSNARDSWKNNAHMYWRWCRWIKLSTVFSSLLYWNIMIQWILSAYGFGVFWTKTWITPHLLNFWVAAQGVCCPPPSLQVSFWTELLRVSLRSVRTSA